MMKKLIVLAMILGFFGATGFSQAQEVGLCKNNRTGVYSFATATELKTKKCPLGYTFVDINQTGASFGCSAAVGTGTTCAAADVVGAVSNFSDTLPGIPGSGASEHWYVLSLPSLPNSGPNIVRIQITSGQSEYVFDILPDCTDSPLVLPVNCPLIDAGGICYGTTGTNPFNPSTTYQALFGLYYWYVSYNYGETYYGNTLVPGDQLYFNFTSSPTAFYIHVRPLTLNMACTPYALQISLE